MNQMEDWHDEDLAKETEARSAGGDMEGSEDGRLTVVGTGTDWKDKHVEDREVAIYAVTDPYSTDSLQRALSLLQFIEVDPERVILVTNMAWMAHERVESEIFQGVTIWLANRRNARALMRALDDREIPVFIDRFPVGLWGELNGVHAGGAPWTMVTTELDWSRYRGKIIKVPEYAEIWTVEENACAEALEGAKVSVALPATPVSVSEEAAEEAPGLWGVGVYAPAALERVIVSIEGADSRVFLSPFAQLNDDGSACKIETFPPWTLANSCQRLYLPATEANVRDVRLHGLDLSTELIWLPSDAGYPVERELRVVESDM